MTDLIRTTFSGGPSGDWLSLMRCDRLLGSDAQDSVDTVHSFWSTLSGIMSNAITAHVSGSVEVLDPITGQPTGVDSVTGYDVAGTDSAEPLPFQTQALIYWNSGSWVGGRQIRGRTFVPGLTEYSNNNGNGPTSFAMGVLAGAAVYIASASSCVPGIYSRAHSNTFPIAGYTVDGKWAFLRSRR